MVAPCLLVPTGSPGRSRRCSAAYVLVLTVAAVIVYGLSGAPTAWAVTPGCTIHGTPGPDTLHGTPGPDTICGGGGADRLFGGPGDDVMIGGAGSDYLSGGPGHDIERGGTGADTCVGSSAQGDQVICQVVHMTGPRPDPGSVAIHSTPPAGPPPDGPPPVEPGILGPGIVGPPPFSEPPGPCRTLDGSCRPHPEFPPLLEGAYFAPESVDLSLGDETGILVLMTADQVGISTASAVIEGPDGARQTVVVHPWDGEFVWIFDTDEPPKPYRQEIKVKIPFHVSPSVALGRYRVVEARIEDPVGFEVSADRAELEQVWDGHSPVIGGSPFMQTYRGPDTTPPELKDLSLPPGEVDEETGLVHFDWNALVADGQTGVTNIDWSLEEPGGNAPEVSVLEGGWLDWGSFVEGHWHGQFSAEALPDGGTWPILGITVEDRVRNKAHYTRADLEAMGLPTELTQEPF